MSDIMWRTKVVPDKLPNSISLSSQLVFVGSCFTENLGTFLREHHFNIVCNPTGIIFNPIPLASVFQHAIEHVIPDDMFHHAGSWRNVYTHSALAHPDKETAIQKLQQAYSSLQIAVPNATHIAVTFGTAWGYRHKQTGIIVANNHKLPASDFDKVLLSASEIAEVWTSIIRRLPHVQWLFTVSPVRHTRDGMVDNMHSKAILLDAVHRLAATSDNVYYFPAFEIMMDDLRDYRFYEADLIHPNAQALQYIRNAFSEACLDERAKAWIDQYAAIIQAKAHKPFFPDTPEYAAFKKGISEKLIVLQNNYPEVDLTADLAWSRG